MLLSFHFHSAHELFGAAVNLSFSFRTPSITAANMKETAANRSPRRRWKKMQMKINESTGIMNLLCYADIFKALPKRINQEMKMNMWYVIQSLLWELIGLLEFIRFHLHSFSFRNSAHWIEIAGAPKRGNRRLAPVLAALLTSAMNGNGRETKRPVKSGNGSDWMTDIYL